MFGVYFLTLLGFVLATPVLGIEEEEKPNISPTRILFNSTVIQEDRVEDLQLLSSTIVRGNDCQQKQNCKKYGGRCVRKGTCNGVKTGKCSKTCDCCILGDSCPTQPPPTLSPAVQECVDTVTKEACPIFSNSELCNSAVLTYCKVTEEMANVLEHAECTDMISTDVCPVIRDQKLCGTQVGSFCQQTCGSCTSDPGCVDTVEMEACPRIKAMGLCSVAGIFCKKTCTNCTSVAGKQVTIDHETFLLSSESVSWDEARLKCLQSNGTLVNIGLESQEQINEIEKLEKQMGSDDFWVGESDRSDEAGDQIAASHDEDCPSMLIGNGLSNSPCAKRKSFVCRISRLGARSQCQNACHLHSIGCGALCWWAAVACWPACVWADLVCTGACIAGSK